MKTEIIYEDEKVLVCYKPAGLPVQTARVGQMDMVSELKNYLHSSYLGIVHRLDQPVEGLLVFAKDKKSAAKLSAYLQQGTLNKQYYGVICGKLSSDRGELVDYLKKDKDHAVVVTEACKEEKDSAQKAVLQYHVIKEHIFREEQNKQQKTTSLGDRKESGRVSEGEATELSLLDIHIDTGRFHQIRAQLSHAGMPLLGDSKYGDERSLLVSRKLQVRNVALCAYKIEFPNPGTGEKEIFEITPRGRVFMEFFPVRREE